MSYQLEQERTGKIPKIEMPPLPQEQSSFAKASEDKPAEYQVHPDIAKEFPTPTADNSETVQVADNLETTEIKQEIIQPDPVVETPPSVYAKASPDTLETSNSKNIRFLREKAQRAEQAERERDALLQRLAQIETTKQNTQSNFTNQPETETNLDPDDFVNAKYLNKYDKKIAQLQEELQQYKQTATATTVDTQIRARYPDFEKVVTQDNIQMLRQEYPEIAATINANPDLYTKAVAAYEMMKKLGINTQDIYLEEKYKVQKNAAKPKPSNSIAPTQGDSPLSKANAFANGLTDEVRKNLWKEMQEAKRNI